MILNGPGKISIMVGGKVVGMATSKQLTISEDDGCTKECQDQWGTPGIKKSLEISGSAFIQEPGKVLRDLMGENDRFEVTIEKNPQKLPRKMKKAYRSDYRRNTKWLCKVRSYITRHMRYHLHDVKIDIN